MSRHMPVARNVGFGLAMRGVDKKEREHRVDEILHIVGVDLVEVSPPYDPSGNTALLGANVLVELLCVLPGVEYRE